MKFQTALPLLLALCLLANRKSTAQYAEKDFVLYSIKNGLSDNEINCIEQDDWGYLWIGTKVGLNRFDGNSFNRFFQGVKPLHLPSDVITRLKKFGPHQLGIFSRGGFQLLNTGDYEVSNYIIPDSTAYRTPLNSAWDAVKTSDNAFALTTAAGFYLLNEKGVQFRHDAFSIQDIGRKQILFGREIFKVNDEEYIVYTNEAEQASYNNRTRKFGPIDVANNIYAPYLHSKRFPGDRWLVRSQLSEHEFIFIPLKVDSIIYYNSLQKLRIASPLPESFSRQIGWESKCILIENAVLLLNCATSGFYKLQFNPQTGKITCDEKKYLSNHQVKCIFRDKENRLWIGSSQGLLKQELTPPPINAFEYPASLPGFSKPFFTCTYRYKKFLYVSQYNRNHGLSIIDAATMKRVKDIRFFGDDLAWNEIFSIEMYHPDTLWLGTYAGLLWFDTRTERYGKVLDVNKYPWAANFSPMLAPPRDDGYAWFCAFLGGRVVRYHIATRSFTVFSPQTTPALPFEKVKSIVYDSYGDVWISGHALTRWSNRSQSFDTVIKIYAGANKFNDDILTISADTRGSLWLHNADNGLLEYQIKQRRFIPYAMKDGLPTISFGAFSPIIDDQLWMASNSQLCLLNTRTKHITLYGFDDGLPEKTATGRRIAFDKTDSLFYLNAGNCLVRFHFVPERKVDRTGEILIEDLTINNTSTRFQPSSEIELTHNENNLGFHFTIVDYDKSNYQFAYRLNNSPSWNFINSQHNLSFNNLSPGKYQLELAAYGKPGVRKTKAVLIVIKPPFWASGWFITLMIVLLAGSCWLLFRARLKWVRKQANIDQQLSKTEMKALQAQMNPHFIFNSLNSIREMILSEENRLASHYLSKFAQLIRITLEQSTQETVSLRATIDYLQRYIEIEAIRNGHLRYEIHVSDELDLDETQVSPMIIQPFVENAIWHGVSATRKDITVKVSFKAGNGTLLCTVDDNGVGISQSRSIKLNGMHRESRGIANVKNRIELLNEKYDRQCSVTIVDKRDDAVYNETGTVVTIQLPYQINEL